MTDIDYQKYTVQAKVAIKGEAFFETLVSEYPIPPASGLGLTQEHTLLLLVEELKTPGLG